MGSLARLVLLSWSDFAILRFPTTEQLELVLDLQKIGKFKFPKNV